jgi:hypothetical protein
MRSHFVSRALSFCLLLLATGSTTSVASAAEPGDNDALVADPAFQGLPDKDSHSGVFLDLIATGSSSIVQPASFGILIPTTTPTLRVAIFDGNAGGLWDMNRLTNDPGGVVVPDGSIVEYTLTTMSPDFPETVVAQGDSENATPRAGAVIFTYADDGRWQFLYDGPHHPSALRSSGEHGYRLLVRYRTPTPLAAINGYKVAINGPFGLMPLEFGMSLVGGFIGGVVDSRNLGFSSTPGGSDSREFSVSRDHYPDLLEPDPEINARLTNGPAYAPAVRYPRSDPYVNRYDGTFDVSILLQPPAGQPWPDFVRSLVLEEGDADDFDDASGLAPDGTPSPSDRGIPPDDGRPYVDNRGVEHDNSGYRLPVAATPQDVGSPWLELFDPLGVQRVVLTDLSGNVSEEEGTAGGFEKIPVPVDGVPGTWRIRMHNLDARNSWFLRTNARLVPSTQDVCGRVYCDMDCDGTEDAGVDTGLVGVVVTVRRTDVSGQADMTATTDATGSWCLRNVPPGVYEVSIAPGQAPIGDRPPSTPQPLPLTVVSGISQTNLSMGFCCRTTECKCEPDGRVHEATFEVWVWGGACDTSNVDVTVRLEDGCDCRTRNLEDFLNFCYEGTFSGDRVGLNGAITVTGVRFEDGLAKVSLKLTAKAPAFPGGFFTGTQRIEVVVNGVSEAVCGKLDCTTLEAGATFPKDWKPRWCGDLPRFHVKTSMPWICWPDRPCTDGCVKTRAWWVAVNASGSCEAQRIAWPVAGGEGLKLPSGRTWLEALKAGAKCDAWTALAQSWIVVQLNVAAGACLPVDVAAAMAEAKTLLEAFPRGFAGQWQTEGRANVVRLILDLYAAGRIGPKACPDKPPTCPVCPPPPPYCPPPAVYCPPAAYCPPPKDKKDDRNDKKDHDKNDRNDKDKKDDDKRDDKKDSGKKDNDKKDEKKDEKKKGR